MLTACIADSLLLALHLDSVLAVAHATDPRHAEHVAFYSGPEFACLTARAFDLAWKEECFFLEIHDYDLRVRENSSTGPVFQIRDLVNEWGTSPLGKILQGPRHVRFFFNPGDRRRGFPPTGMLESATAIELARPECGPEAIVFFTNSDWPCVVQIATDEAERRTALTALEEFQPKLFAVNKQRQ